MNIPVIKTCSIVFAASLFMIMNCSKKSEQPLPSLITTAHLDHLYEQVTIQDTEMGIIHIYSNYPDYQWVDASGEGIACVDDVARAAIFYLELYKQTNKPEYELKMKNMIKFLKYMQADNGWFYNFIEKDYSINRTHKNSTALPTWWTWRALWAISEVALFFKDKDYSYVQSLQTCMAKSVQSLLNQKPNSMNLKRNSGFDLPTWLPYETGADQAAILILFLVNYYQITKDQSLLLYLKDLCNGILKMQQGDVQNFPYSVFLSWENNWHGWGNMQSYALLYAYPVLQDQNVLSAALAEIDHFYTYLYQQNFLADFSIQRENGKIIILTSHAFPQIAYILTPMVWACLQAGQISRNTRYDIQAAELARWFFGANPGKKQMYDPHTGRCCDGIESIEKINENSGAESTIEALLTLNRIEQNPIARKHLAEYINTVSEH